jgi:hypothetical protein
MTVATYEGGGGIRIGGCAAYKLTINVAFPYGPGQTVYLIYRAQKGILEKITIKRINLVRRGSYQRVPIYVDMNNFLYNEDELCYESQAIDYAVAYYASVIEQIGDMAAHC